MENVDECVHCGAKYEVRKIKLPYRDSDSIDCEVCGKELMSWNGAVAYSATLISKPGPSQAK